MYFIPQILHISIKHKFTFGYRDTTDLENNTFKTKQQQYFFLLELKKKKRLVHVHQGKEIKSKYTEFLKNSNSTLYVDTIFSN